MTAPKRRVTITTEQTDVVYIDFLESRDGPFQSHYNMVIDSSAVTQPDTVLVIISWLDFNDEMMSHPELVISQ